MALGGTMQLRAAHGACEKLGRGQHRLRRRRRGGQRWRRMRSKSRRNGWELQYRQRQPGQEVDKKRRPGQAQSASTLSQPSLKRGARVGLSVWERGARLGRPGGERLYDLKMKRWRWRQKNSGALQLLNTKAQARRRMNNTLLVIWIPWHTLVSGCGPCPLSRGWMRGRRAALHAAAAEPPDTRRAEPHFG